MNSILKKLKELELEEKRLAEKKQQLIKEQKLIEEKQKKLDSIFKNSGYSNPKDLVEDLIEKFGLRVTKSSSSATSSTDKKKRTRTRITAELRDEIKQELTAGSTKVAVSKSHGISYVVVGKIAKGDYDHL